MKRTIAFILLLVCVLSVTVYAEFFQIPQDAEVPEGAYGVWQCSAINVNVPLYTSKKTTGARQKVVDKEDSALITTYGKGRLIADHYQSEIGEGMWEVNKMTVGEAAFLIRDGKPTLAYQCTAIWMCKQKRNNYQYNGKAIYPAKNDIVCVCCAEDDGWVYLAYFKYMGKMP